MTRRPVTAPYSEPLLPQLDIDNPYYTDLHRNLRAYVRDYVESSIAPYAQDWEAAGEVPESVRLRHCALGFNIVHPLTTPEDAAGLSLPGNVPRDRWDTWCSLIVTDELARVGFIGVIWGLGGGNAIGCPPIARFGSPEQRRRWLPGVAKGELRFCLGITEPDGEDSSSGTSLIYVCTAHTNTASSWIGRCQHQHNRAKRGRPLHRQRRKEMDHQRHLGRLLHRCGAHWRTRTKGSQRACHSSQREGRHSQANVQFWSPCERYVAPNHSSSSTDDVIDVRLCLSRIRQCSSPSRQPDRARKRGVSDHHVQ